jgi:hypothetical protein
LDRIRSGGGWFLLHLTSAGAAPGGPEGLLPRWVTHVTGKIKLAVDKELTLELRAKCLPSCPRRFCVVCLSFLAV